MRVCNNRAVLPKENQRIMLMDESATDKPEKARIRVYGRMDTELVIRHRDIPAALVEKFVDGWVTGRRNEPFIHTRYHRIKPRDVDWNYGYDLAQQGGLYFSQALHSFFTKLERERRI